jgi:hypothetical protein
MSRWIAVEGVDPGGEQRKDPAMRTAKSVFYSAIVAEQPMGAPSMKEARRDLDHAFFTARLGALSF